MKKFTFLLLGFFILAVLGSTASAVIVEADPSTSPLYQIRRPRVHVDFEITYLRVDQASNDLYVKVKNNSIAHFSGDVVFQVKTIGTSSQRIVSAEVFFEGKGTWETLLPGFDGNRGSKTFEVTIDPYNEVTEQNENNNTYRQTVQFAGQRGSQDLAVTALYRSNNIIYYTVKNLAQNIFEGMISIRFEQNGVYKSLFNQGHVSWQSGQGNTYILDCDLELGRNTVWLKVDPGNNVIETNERNNIKQEDFYPNIQHIELVKYAKVGRGNTVSIATRTHAKVIIRPNYLRNIGGDNWGIDVISTVRGQGAQAMPSYMIILQSFFNGAKRTEKIYHLSAGPVNGKTKDDRHDFFLPKQYCRNGQTGKLYIQLIVDGKNLGVWRIDVEFEGF